jgi:hypothetical protein
MPPVDGSADGESEVETDLEVEDEDADKGTSSRKGIKSKVGRADISAVRNWQPVKVNSGKRKAQNGRCVFSLNFSVLQY